MDTRTTKEISDIMSQSENNRQKKVHAEYVLECWKMAFQHTATVSLFPQERSRFRKTTRYKSWGFFFAQVYSD